MKIEDAQHKLREMVAFYFGKGHVFYAGQKMAKLPEPYVTLQFTGMTRQANENIMMDDDGYSVAYRDIVLSVDLNLYTKGRSIGGSAIVCENTSLSDLTDFLDYLDSEEGQGYQMEHGIAITVTSDPRDLSALIREAQYQYRAMAGLSVRITDTTYGDYGQNGKTLPNASGGGNKDMYTDPYTIESVDVTDAGSE